MPEMSPEQIKKTEKVQEEIKKILDDNNCYVDIFVTIGTDNTIKGEFRIIPR